MQALVAALILLFAAFAGPARAGGLVVEVVDSAGRATPDALVQFVPEGGYAGGPIRFAWPYEVRQRDLAFEPRVLVVPVGAAVRFPNLDRVRHHVYSFSAGHRFELELYGRDETRSHTFTREGLAAIGCNIHDRMQAYVVVVATPHVAWTDASGRASLPGAAGAGEVRIWRHDLRARGGFQTVRVGAGDEVARVAVTLRAPITE